MSLKLKRETRAAIDECDGAIACLAQTAIHVLACGALALKNARAAKAQLEIFERNIPRKRAHRK